MRYSKLGAQQARRNGVGARGARSRSAGTALGSRLGRAWTGAERADGRAGGARARQASGSSAGARRRSGRASAGARGRRAAGARGTAGRCSRRGRPRGAGPGRGWALGVRAGQDCALGALDLIFKPVFRLSIFPESVNEHCSL